MLSRWYVLSVSLALLMVAASCQGGDSSRSARTTAAKAPADDGTADNDDTSTQDGDAEGSDATDTEVEYEANDATYYQDVQAVLEKRCASCHATQAPVLTTYMEHYLARDEIDASIRADRMPPDAPLSAAEKDLVLGWIKAGAARGAKLEFTNFGDAPMTAAHDKAEIDVKIDAGSGATWSLYWTKDANDTTAGELAVAPQSIVNTTGEWFVSDMEAGDYYLYATVQAEQRQFTFKAPQVVRLGQPSIRLATSWRKGRIGFLNGADVSYSYGNVGSRTVSVRVEYKRGASSTAYTNLTDAAGATSYTLPTLPEGDDYYIRVSLLENGNVIASHQTQDLIAFADQYYAIESLEGNCMAFNCHPNHGTLQKNEYFMDRIKNAASPMPPNGLLPADDQLKLRLWYWQNYQN